MVRKSVMILFSMLVVASMVLAACAPQKVVETVVVTGQPEEKVVEKIVEVTSTPAPAAEVSMKSKDPNTFVYTTYGDPENFDPALDYETAGGLVIFNTYETLVTFKRQSPTELVPQLATEWNMSDDGKTYTFTIRKGVKFHNGDELTVDDVVYSFQRGLLQGSAFSPQLLLTEPLLGVGVYDITDIVAEKGKLEEAPADDPEALAKVDPAVLADSCDVVKKAVVADEAAGTVTFNLAQAWSPFMVTLAHQVASVVDKKWAIEQGAWDGDCATWQNFYAKTAETTPLRDKINGTGPYKLESWTPKEEIVLTRNDDYWRTEPAWEGGPSGPAKTERVVIKIVEEWGTRFAMIQAGDSDVSTVDLVNITQIDPLVGELCEHNADTNDYDCKPTDNPTQPLRLFKGAPGVTRQDVMFNFDINVEGGNNLIGSGKLDGNGITPDFFSDIHVRKAFNYCFDFDTFMNETQHGEAVRGVGVLIPGAIGWDPNGNKYEFDLEKCKSEIEQAWGGEVAKNGFRLQLAYNSGNMNRQTVAQILQSDWQEVDPKYVIEILALPWPTFNSMQKQKRLPVFISGWQEDIHDSHNWAQPFLAGDYATRQNMPKDMLEAFKTMVTQGVSESDPAKRADIYKQIDDKDYEDAPAIRLSVPTTRWYEQRWVKGFYYNPIYPNEYYFYALSKD